MYLTQFALRSHQVPYLCILARAYKAKGGKRNENGTYKIDLLGQGAFTFPKLWPQPQTQMLHTTRKIPRRHTQLATWSMQPTRRQFFGCGGSKGRVMGIIGIVSPIPSFTIEPPTQPYTSAGKRKA